MRTAGRGPSLRVASFWIRPVYSLLYVFQCAPAIVNGLDLAVAINLVPVLSANWTNSPASLAAYSLHRERQKNVLPQNISQFQPAALVETDLGLTVVDLQLSMHPSSGWHGRPVKQVETRFE